MPDFTVENHGTIWLVRPSNDDARTWLNEHTDGTWFGGALAVEPRYVEALVEGITEHGFTLA